MTDSSNQVVNVTISLMITDEAIDEGLIGAGLYMYYWWGDIRKVDSGYSIVASNDDGEGVINRFVSYDDIRQTIVNILCGTAGSYAVRGGLINSIYDGALDFSNIDASLADEILQVAFYGEVIYG